MDNDGLPPGFQLDDTSQVAQATPDVPQGFQLDEDQYGTPSQTALGLTEKAAKGAFGPVATLAEAGLSSAGIPGLSPAEQQGREAALGGAGTAAEAGGFLASALTGVGEAKWLAEIGEMGAAALGVEKGITTAGKIGSAAVKGAIENATYSAGDIGSKIINGADPATEVQSAVPYLGLSAVIGGGLGAGLGGVSELWKARYAGDTGGVLRTVVDKLGGHDTVVADPISRALEQVGIQPKPEIVAAMASDPAIQAMAKALEQSDATSSGQAYQAALKEFHGQAQEAIANAFGKSAEELAATPQLSKYKTGEAIGDLAGNELDAQIKPLSEAYEAHTEQYADTPLDPSSEQKQKILASSLEKAQSQLDALTKVKEITPVTGGPELFEEAPKPYEKVGNEPVKGVRTPSKYIGTNRLEAIKAENNIGAGGKEYSEGELEDLLQRKYQAKADKATAGFENAQTGEPVSPLPDSPEIIAAKQKIAAIKAAGKEPGTTDRLLTRLQEVAAQEGWFKDPEGIGMKAYQKVARALPLQETLGDITKYIKNVGDELQKGKFPGDPSIYIGGRIKSVLREGESETLANALGQKEGAEALQNFRNLQAAYASKAQIKEELQSVLHIKGANNVTGFGQAVRDFGQESGEKLIERLSGKNNANTLNLLQKYLPQTAQAVREYHIDKMIEASTKRVKAGENINIPALQSYIDGLSPELKQFAVPKNLSEKLEGMSVLQDQLNRVPHNFSNTARTSAVLNKYGLSAGIGMVSMLTGHGVAASVIAGEIAHTLGKTAPDALRLSLLKFLGSDKPIDSVAFKAMADFIQSANKGENLTLNAAKSFFKGTSAVIPTDMIPNTASREKLQKSLDYAGNPQTAMNVGGSLPHYLPEHGTATAALSQTAVNYLKTLKPIQIQASPLDKPAPVDMFAQAKYNRQLDIAQQPLLAIQHAKDGTLQPQDMMTLNTIYPGLAKKFGTQLFEEMNKSLSEGNQVPYQQRVSLSMLMGQPLDSTLSQPGLASIMMANAPKNQAPMQGKPQKVSQATQKGVEKVNKMFATPAQTRIAGRSNE